jgi:hypothetical protein
MFREYIFFELTVSYSGLFSTGFQVCLLVDAISVRNPSFVKLMWTNKQCAKVGPAASVGNNFT